MIYTMITSFLTTYLLFQGINPAKTGTVMLIVKIWDAINDAIFGCVFDKVKFKSKKKFLPWLKISLPIIPLATALLYMIPNGSTEMVKLIWFAVFYLVAKFLVFQQYIEGSKVPAHTTFYPSAQIAAMIPAAKPLQDGRLVRLLEQLTLGGGGELLQFFRQLPV